MSYRSESEADIIRRLEAEGVGKDPAKAYLSSLTILSDEITELFKEGINKKTKGSGALGQSVIAIPTKDGFTIQADAYYKFVDRGVNAAPTRQGLKYNRPKVTGSIYSFKNMFYSKGMLDSLRNIISGDMSNVIAVAVSIKKHGLKAKNITDEVITDELLDKIADDLARISGVTVGIVFERHSK